MTFKELICLLINVVKIPEMYMYFRKRMFGNHIVIFVYHRVFPGKVNLPVASIGPKEFEKQIRYLKENFKLYSLEKLINVLENNQINKKESENIAVITFDDGYRDNYIYAFPILKKYQIPATIFLVTGYIGKDKLFWWDKIEYIIYHTKKREINIPNFSKFFLTNDKKKLYCFLFLLKKFKKMTDNLRDKHINELQNICCVRIPTDLGKKMILSWDEIREMQNNEISFRTHSLTHANLINMNLEKAEKEISESKAMIDEKLKADVRSFAYPYGSKFYNHDIIKLLEKNGFICAVTTSERIINKSKFHNLYSLPRISAGNYFCSFTIKASGIFSDFNNILHS